MKELYSTIHSDIDEMIYISEHCLFDYEEFLGALDDVSVNQFADDHPLIMDTLSELREMQKRLRTLRGLLSPRAEEEQKELDDIDPS